MENAVWSVIKYKPQAGCADEFKEALERLSEIKRIRYKDDI